MLTVFISIVVIFFVTILYVAYSLVKALDAQEDDFEGFDEDSEGLIFPDKNISDSKFKALHDWCDVDVLAFTGESVRIMVVRIVDGRVYGYVKEQYLSKAASQFFCPDDMVSFRKEHILQAAR